MRRPPAPGAGNHRIKLSEPRLPAQLFADARGIGDQHRRIARTPRPDARRQGVASDAAHRVQHLQHRVAAADADVLAAAAVVERAQHPDRTQFFGRVLKHRNLAVRLDVMGTIARPTIASYVASKAGLHGLTRALAVEFGPLGINVNCIGPGFYPASQNEIVRRDKTFYDWVSNRAPLGRWGDPAELGGAVIYFASEASSFCNGQVLMVDGGMTVAL